jgi:hypothetical protein
MRLSLLASVALGIFASTGASAADFFFNTDPFAGSTALTTPGRQVVGGESFIGFDTSTDRFVLDPAVFAVGNTVNFANDIASNLATSGLNVIVLESFDDDGTIATPFAAGNAANLIANRVTAPGAGFFIYFNQGLNTPRLVYSTDLNDNTSDLMIVARMTNLAGNPGALAGFGAANFAFAASPAGIPEPTTWATMLAGFGLLGAALRRRRQQARPSYA